MYFKDVVVGSKSIFEQDKSKNESITKHITTIYLLYFLCIDLPNIIMEIATSPLHLFLIL